MKRKILKHLYLSLVSGVTLIVYMNTVAPSIEKPLTIAIFFGLVFIALYLLIATLLFWKAPRFSPYITSAVVTLSMLYLIALMTIHSLDWIDVAIVVVVATLVIQLVVVQRKH